MKSITLSNGLTILLQKVSGKALTVHASVQVGSVNEEEGQKGYSHFVEHMLFEGTKKRPDAQQITEVIENIGGDINAATSNETTYYYAKVVPKYFEKAIDVLSDMLINSVFDPKIVQKEAKVILEEIKMINDQPRYYQWIAFEQTIFKDSSYESPVYGLTKDVSSATSDSLKAYYKKHYVPSNCTITIVGNYDSEDELLTTVDSYFGSWKSEDISTNSPVLPKKGAKSADFFKEISQVYIIAGALTPSVLSDDSPVFEVIEAILGKPQSGWMNHEIRNKRGMAYDVGVMYDTMQDFGFFVINVGTDPDSVEEVLSLITQEIARLDSVSEDELANAKSYVEGKMILELESTSRYAELLSYWQQVAKKDITQEYLDKVQKVSLADVSRVAKKYLSELTVVKVLPKS